MYLYHIKLFNHDHLMIEQRYFLQELMITGLHITGCIGEIVLEILEVRIFETVYIGKEIEVNM